MPMHSGVHDIVLQQKIHHRRSSLLGPADRNLIAIAIPIPDLVSIQHEAPPLEQHSGAFNQPGSRRYDQINSMAQQRPPQLGATFYPGGQDDFYMYAMLFPVCGMHLETKANILHSGQKLYPLYRKGM